MRPELSGRPVCLKSIHRSALGLTSTALLWIITLAAGPLLQAQELSRKPSDLAYRALDLKYPVAELKGAPQEMKGAPDTLKTPAAALSATPAPLAATAMDVKETETELKISLLGDILFDYDKADIRPAAEPTLAQVAKMIQGYPKATVLIEGHTDAKGSQSYNAKLSERRTASVKTWLVAKGIAEQIVRTRGLGAAKPVAPNSNPDGSDNPEGRQKNRRVEITIKK